MEYQTIKASSDLETFIKCFWTLRIPNEFPKDRQQILPDGCLEMIFNLGDEIKRYTIDDKYILQPRSFILGQINEPFYVEPTGSVDTFAIRFFPGSFSNFTEVSMADLADKETELNVLFEERQIEKIETDIAKTNDTPGRIDIIENFLLTLLGKNTNVHGLLNLTIDTILQTNGRVNVNKILKNHEEKRRQLERKFSRAVGLSPKQLCRIIRLQATLQAMLSDKHKSLTSVGYENHYFDQSHFIKDFREFTGVSPGEFYKAKQYALSSILYKEN